MGKYKVEVTYTVTYTHTFEVEASNSEEASDKANDAACDFNMRDGKESDSGYAFDIVESPVDRMECPECGGELKVEVLEGAGKSLEDVKTCCECGAHY